MTRLLLCLCAAGLLSAADAPRDLPLVFQDDFEKGADRWESLDAKSWKVAETDKGKVFSQFEKKSDLKPPHRSPLHIALIKDVTVGDFVFEAKCKSTEKDYGHRDLCIFFGYQGPDRFYYAHLAKKTDDRANQVFLVDRADRKKISTKTTPGTDWTDGWHTIKVVRSVKDGTIEVYFDDMKTPVMTATDKSFTSGRVGVGSFDDTGAWDDVRLWGEKR